MLKLLPIILLLLGCSFNESSPGCDIKIATANILIENSVQGVEEELLKMDCDIYLLHEAVIGINLESKPFTDRGYELFSHEESSIPAFNGVLISRIPGEFSSMENRYEYGFIDYVEVAPYYKLNFLYNSKNISLIGAHIPPSVLMFDPKELEELRREAINDLASSISGGRDELGAEVIIGGDFNTHPSDSILKPLLNAGLEDSFLVNSERYNKTWAPFSFLPDLARIDYFFVSKNIETVYERNFNIRGSDHRGIVIGVNIK